MRKIVVLLMAMFVVSAILAAPPKSAGAAKNSVASQDSPQEDRISGTIVRSNSEKSTLIVRQSRSDIERTVLYSSATRWTKGKEAADMKQFKDGSRVICLGKLNEKGELIATRIDLQ
jgi:hypothetical protein